MKPEVRDHSSSYGTAQVLDRFFADEPENATDDPL
jgi:hypothetical protein